MAKAIFISGVIGSGKTTLSEKLSKEHRLKLKTENTKGATIFPKIHNVYSTFDPQTIFEVQCHFLEDSSRLSEDLEEGHTYVFDTYPFVSQMVFIEALKSLRMIDDKHFKVLKEKLMKFLKPLTFIDHIHIHCSTPKDIFTRILERGSFEVGSFEEDGKPSSDLVRLLEELDFKYYDLAITHNTVFASDPLLDNKLKSFLYGE